MIGIQFIRVLKLETNLEFVLPTAQDVAKTSMPNTIAIILLRAGFHAILSFVQYIRIAIICSLIIWGVIWSSDCSSPLLSDLDPYSLDSASWSSTFLSLWSKSLNRGSILPQHLSVSGQQRYLFPSILWITLTCKFPVQTKEVEYSPAQKQSIVSCDLNYPTSCARWNLNTLPPITFSNHILKPLKTCKPQGRHSGINQDNKYTWKYNIHNQRT